MIARRFSLAALALTLAAPSFAQSAEAPPADAEAAKAAADADLAGAPAAAPASPAPAPTPAPAEAPAAPAAPASPQATYKQTDVITAAQRVFGQGAEGLGKLIERIFKEQGEPIGYIEGREVGGAFVVGLRYGSGTLHHKVEGDIPVYWTGPSLGVDFGGDGSKTFTLVYNLNDSAELFQRYPAVEGKVYAIGGFTANYLRRDDVILVPIKLGVGWRFGANLGYLNFTRESRINPL
ncbi:MAG: DUF1134 domain-containing protein [Alphaproteobacteria bacterium]|nr:DUF1134 domain-containing protein [Alphaproteobacteria bacterium]